MTAEDKCDICERKSKNLTPYYNANVEIFYEQVCKHCHNLYNDYFVTLKKKQNDKTQTD